MYIKYKCIANLDSFFSSTSRDLRGEGSEFMIDVRESMWLRGYYS